MLKGSTILMPAAPVSGCVGGGVGGAVVTGVKVPRCKGLGFRVEG